MCIAIIFREFLEKVHTWLHRMSFFWWFRSNKLTRTVETGSSWTVMVTDLTARIHSESVLEIVSSINQCILLFCRKCTSPSRGHSLCIQRRSSSPWKQLKIMESGVHALAVSYVRVVQMSPFMHLFSFSWLIAAGGVKANGTWLSQLFPSFFFLNLFIWHSFYFLFGVW